MTKVSLYTPIWHKYRPAILSLMMKSEETPQTYSLSAHEFTALSNRPKGGHQFSLHVSNGKPINNIKDSMLAQDLLAILRQSPRGSALIEAGSYEIKLDKDFILHIQKLRTL